MTKIQKVWLGLFLALFIVPEVLWSPVGNFIYELYKNTGFPFRYTFLENTDNVDILTKVLFIQFLGLAIPAIYLVVLQKQIQHRAILWLLVIVLTILSLVIFLLFWASISLRNIGF